MANALIRGLQRSSSLIRSSSPVPLSIRSVLQIQESIYLPSIFLQPTISTNLTSIFRNFSHGSVNLVISEGKPKFETHEVEPPKKWKWLTKKKLKLQRKKEREKRRAANRKDPRRLTIKGKKRKFENAEGRIKYKLEKAKIKEAQLIERLKRYEVPKVQGPEVQPHELTGEERFYMKKMAQKRSNYVPIGRRGVFGGVILNMHMHWKKHETVKVICKNCKPGQVQQYAEELARLSGGIPIQIIGDDTIIFYRGKNYVQPEVMSPIDTLSKKRALEKSKYEQSLESVRRFIAISEKELELYCRHIALYGDPNNRNPLSVLDCSMKSYSEESRKLKTAKEENHSHNDSESDFSLSCSEEVADSEVEDEDEDEDEDGEELSGNDAGSEKEVSSERELDSGNMSL